MVVKVTPKFSYLQIKNIVLMHQEKIEQAILMRLQKTGEEFVTSARTNGSYQDQTGNLRNSIGYIILKDGKQLFDNFKRSATVTKTLKSGKTKATAGANEGVSVGKRVAKEVAQRFPTGFVLICVAGMDYAAAVESNGKDVITASSKIAEVSLRLALQTISSKISRMK